MWRSRARRAGSADWRHRRDAGRDQCGEPSLSRSLPAERIIRWPRRGYESPWCPHPCSRSFSNDEFQTRTNPAMQARPTRSAESSDYSLSENRRSDQPKEPGVSVVCLSRFAVRLRRLKVDGRNVTPVNHAHAAMTASSTVRPTPNATPATTRGVDPPPIVPNSSIRRPSGAARGLATKRTRVGLHGR